MTKTGANRGARLPLTLALALAAAVAAPTGCNSGGKKKRRGKTSSLQGAVYTDTNGSRSVDAGDRIRATFDEDVAVQGTPGAGAVFVAPPGGSFGTGASVTPVDSRTIDVVLAAGASLQPNGIFGVDPGASGFNLAVGQSGLVDGTGGAVVPLGTAVDLAGEIGPGIVSAVVNKTALSCALGTADTIELTFDAAVTLTTADPAQAFVLPVTGDSLGTGAQFPGGGMPLSVTMVTIELGSGAVITTAGTYDPLVLGAGSPSGIDVTATPGLVVDAAAPTVSASQAVPVGLDLPAPATQPWVWASSGDDTFNAEYGTSSASAGDVNNDGYDDVIVGAPNDGGTGKAYLYHGSAAGLSPTPDWTSTGDGQGGAFFGYEVSTAGDVNNDGYDDVVVGAEGFDAVNTDSGKAYVYHGSAAGLELIPSWTSSGDDAGADGYGEQVDAAGDVNGDGYDDLLVGSAHWAGTQAFVGKAYVYHGGPTGLEPTETWFSIGDDQDRANFGNGADGAGDVDGDGFADVIIGAPGWDGPTGSNVGKSYVFLGSASGLGAAPAWEGFGDNLGGTQYGYDVAGAGDVDNDGFDDVIAGANIQGGQIGKAFVYHGSATGPSPAHDWSATGDNLPSSWFSNVVAAGGDLNADGFADVVVGAPLQESATATDAGKAFVYLGSATGLALTPAWDSFGEDQDDGWFGSSVGTAGDTDGDGRDEILIGALRFDTTNMDAGKVYLFCGP